MVKQGFRGALRNGITLQDDTPFIHLRNDLGLPAKVLTTSERLSVLTVIHYEALNKLQEN